MRIVLLLSLLSWITVTHLAAREPAVPTNVVTTAATWKGAAQESFSFEGRPAYVVKPRVAAAGRPWVWRMSFPNFHSAVDEELLHCGFHIAYLNVVEMLGSDAALDRMERFEAQVRAQWTLADRMVIEPCSRGGLHAYRYAARHPHRVACILGDVPVMDLKSWPLQWPGAKKQVQDALRYYGFADVAALRAYRGNPIDLLEPIAAARIPIRHVIGLDDKVVPPEQNTLEAQRRLRALGHDMEIVIGSKGVRGSGHHFDYPEVQASVGFVLRHASLLSPDPAVAAMRHGVSNAFHRFAIEKTARVAFLGGSITYGGGWRDEMMRYLKQRFPETRFEFIAAGIPSVGSNGHAFRLSRDVLSKGRIDLLFVEAAVNDGSNIPEQPGLMLRSMEGVVRQMRRAQPAADIVMLHFAMGPALQAYASGKVPVPIAQHERVAAHYGCVTVDLTREVQERIALGQLTWEKDFRANVHPPPFGHRLYANAMIRMFEEAFRAPPPGQVTPHKLPPSKLDPHAFDQGHFGDLKQAELGQGFRLDPSWKPAKGGTRAGFVGVPALVAEQPGSEFTYEFTGTAFGLFLAAGHDSCVLDYEVDGGETKSVDTFTRWSKGLHLPWPLMLAEDLKPGPHSITVRTSNRAQNRHALHVIHVLLNGP